MSKKLTTDEFILRASKLHNNKYDYSKVDYIKTDIKVLIICPFHGDFTQKPHYHLGGSECPKCASITIAEKNTKGFDSFIKRANIVHSKFYNYDSVLYKNRSSKINILCPLHGVYTQTPALHLQGYGCTACGGKRVFTQSDFIKTASEIHNSYYDYSEVIYTDSRTKVKIKCPKHGIFEQQPYSHLQGKNCIRCSYGVSRMEEEWLDIIGLPNNFKYRQVKIGNIKVDGYDEKTRTIYEFLGDFWHGNPKKHKHNSENRVSKKSFKSLYLDTFKRFDLLKKQGYIIKYIWETDWMVFKNNTTQPMNILIYCGTETVAS